MTELAIAFDNNFDDEFLGKKHPVYEVTNFSGGGEEEYALLAEQILSAYPESPTILVHCQNPTCSQNRLAVALFLKAYHSENCTDCVVFKTQDKEKAVASYRPYVALTIALKYVLRLINEDAKTVYKEIALLNYLGLTIRRDYQQNKLIVSHEGSVKAQKFITHNPREALVAIGILKTLAIAGADIAITAEMNLTNQGSFLSEKEIMAQILEYTAPWMRD